MRNGNTDQFYIALTCADGCVSVMGFVTCEYFNQLLEDGSTVERKRWIRLASKEHIEYEIARLEAEYSTSAPHKVPIQSWRFLTDEEVVATHERELRNALVDTGSELVHDMVKARELHKQRVLRPARALLFKKTDDEYRLADEAGDKAAKKRIVQRKQELRDITADPAIANATTIDELKTAALDKLSGG